MYVTSVMYVLGMLFQPYHLHMNLFGKGVSQMCVFTGQIPCQYYRYLRGLKAHFKPKHCESCIVQLTTFLALLDFVSRATVMAQASIVRP